MARARSIKPGFFKNEQLAELPPHARLLFAGLWTIADRAGRLEDRPKRIKAEIFPYETVKVEPLLERLAATGFIFRYSTGQDRYICIPTWDRHQNPHVKEPASTIPAPDEYGASTVPESFENSSKTPSSSSPIPLTPFPIPSSQIADPNGSGSLNHAEPEKSKPVLNGVDDDEKADKPKNPQAELVRLCRDRGVEMPIEEWWYVREQCELLGVDVFDFVVFLRPHLRNPKTLNPVGMIRSKLKAYGKQMRSKALLGAVQNSVGTVEKCSICGCPKGSGMLLKDNEIAYCECATPEFRAERERLEATKGARAQ